MDVLALQNELESLPPDQQDRISAFLTVLRMKREGLMAEVKGRLDDSDAGNWVPWEDVRSEFGESDAGLGQ